MEWNTSMKSIAIIPARSGSKGLKDKNIKLLNGRPMLAYTVEAAQKTGIFDSVYVSTDSEAYGEIARQWGAEVPFLRTDELASDTAGTWDMVRWTLERFQARGKRFERVALLQPTSPLRNHRDILAAHGIMEEKQARAVVSVCEMEHSPLWSNVLPEDGNMKGFIREELAVRRQGLAAYYRLNGAIYLLDAALLWQEPMELYGEKTYAYVMPKKRSVDIDDEFDFAVAEAMISKGMV